MRANQLPCVKQPVTPSPARLPGYRFSRLDDAAFWLLGIATGCAVIFFFNSIARFAANADRFVARLHGAPPVVRQTNYANSSQATNQPGRFHLIQSSADAPSSVQPDAPARTPSTI